MDEIQMKYITIGKTGRAEYDFDKPNAIHDFYKLPRFARKGLAEEGISKSQLVQIKEAIDIDFMTFSSLIGIAIRTLHAKKNDNLFNEHVSNNILSLVELYSFGYRFFPDPSVFNQWMKVMNIKLGNMPPIQYCKYFFGKDAVKEEIGRLNCQSGVL